MDGIVGKATWYQIKSIYNAVKGLGELVSEGLTFDEVDRIYSTTLQTGDTGNPVRVIQYYLAVLGYFDDALPRVAITGNFDSATEDAVRQFQAQQGLAVDGIVGRDTWNALTRAYQQLRASLPDRYLQPSEIDEIYPGYFLTPGQSGEDVAALQRLLIRASGVASYIPPVVETGTYDEATENAVRAVQQAVGLPVNGLTGPLAWAAIANLAKQA